MNYEDDNQKQIDKLERMEKIYADAEHHESVMDKIDAEEEEDICAFPRKIFKVILLIVWAGCLMAVFTGADFLLPVCGVLFSLGIYTALCVTKFLKKRKYWDTVVSAITAIACISLAIILLVNG